MNYRQIEIFVAVLETGSVTEAATRLGLSQPAVSKSLKMLENSLKLQLFLRSPKGLVATDEARSLYLEAGRLTNSFAHLWDFARNLPKMHHARLEVSCIPALAISWLPAAIAGFIAQYPEVTLSFVSRSSPQTVQLVAQGEIDIGISQARAEDVMVEKRRLFDLRAACVLPRGHALCQKDVLTLGDLNGERIVSLGKADEMRKTFEAAMHRQGHTFQTKIDVALGAMLCRMVEAGAGIGIVDSESAKTHGSPRVVTRPLEPRIAIPIYLLQNTSRPLSLVARKFVDHVCRQTAAG